MLTKKTLLVLLCTLVFPICPLLYGQATGSFSGTVSDKTGSVITGAKVTATSQGTGAAREAKTDDTGHFVLPLVPIGDYKISVEATGFQTTSQADIKLQVDEHREVNFSLAPGQVTERVEVTGAEVAVQTTNPTLGQVITEQQVAQLPLNGRNFVQLATLTPGTTQETNPGQLLQRRPKQRSIDARVVLAIGGRIRASSTDWLLDGNDNNELTAGGIAVVPSIDAIQEFKVLTYNYSAQYGTRAGPTVSPDHKVRGRTSFTERCLNSSATRLWMREATLRMKPKDSTSTSSVGHWAVQSRKIRRFSSWITRERGDVLGRTS